MILHIRLPGIDGLEVGTRIRQKSVANDRYILMLTYRGEEIDQLRCLATRDRII